MPVFATDVLHAGAAGLGLLRGAPAIGVLVVSGLKLRRTGQQRADGNLLFWMILFSVATMLFACSRWMLLSVIMLALVGASQMVGLLIRTSLIQLATPDGMRGRVGAISWLLLGASNEMGGVESALTAHWLGALRAVALGGFASLLVTGTAYAIFPELRITRERLGERGGLGVLPVQAGSARQGRSGSPAAYRS